MRPFIRVICVLLLQLIPITTSLISTPQLNVVDTPTAATMFQGGYSVSLIGYESGGILTKTVVGIHDNVFIGASFDIEHVIGRDDVKFNIPGVLGKLKITDNIGSVPLLISMGYDAFYTDDIPVRENIEGINSRLVYGPYAVITKPFFIGNFEQHLHFGIRLPVQPFYRPEDTSMYISYDFQMGQFVPMLEMERIFFDSTRFTEIYYNTGIRFNLYETLAVQLNFMLGYKERANRTLHFEYVSSF